MMRALLLSRRYGDPGRSTEQSQECACLQNRADQFPTEARRSEALASLEIDREGLSSALDEGGSVRQPVVGHLQALPNEALRIHRVGNQGD